MNLTEYDGKYVRIRDTHGNVYSGRARYGGVDLLECEWGMDEDGIFIEDILICYSQIESIEEIVPHGTVELQTEHIVLRRYRPDDAEQLYQQFGTDPEMYTHRTGAKSSYVSMIIEMEAFDMGFFELAKNRYSERFFDPKPVEQEKLDKILEAGRIVPTACNYQPQKFYLIRSKEGLEKLKTVTHFHYNVPLMILVCYDAREVWTNPGDQYYRNYNSGEQDASIAATTMMYEAEELGVHTIWIRGFDSKTVVDTYGLPDHMIPVMMLGLGYPNEKAKANAWHYKRRPIEDFVFEL